MTTLPARPRRRVRDQWAILQLQVRERRRTALLTIGEFSHNSPAAAVAPWLGTLFGSWIVGSNTESITALIVGAVVAGLGCTPVAAAAYWQRADKLRYARREARERKALEWASVGLIPLLGDGAGMPRKKRVELRDDVLVRTVEHLESKIYGEENDIGLRPDKGTRVVLYTVDDTGAALRVMHQEGRPDPAASFVNGDGGRGDKAFKELLSTQGTYEADLDGRSYVTYISAPIAHGKDIFGMLCVDSTDVEGLDKDDRDALEVIAAALAVFFLEAERGARR